MKFRRTPSKHQIKASLNMTPLIDVVLLLVLFFMLSSTFVSQTLINIEMPEAQGLVDFQQKDLSLTLAYGDSGPGHEGAIYVDNDQIANMEELGRRLAAEVAERPDLRVLIRPDARVPTGRLVEVFGYIHGAGITRYYIAAEPASNKE